MRPRMLIVDDEPDICDCLGTYFSQHGYAIDCALSGESAITHISIEPPDVILLDVRLPGCSGLDVLSRVKTQFPHMRVVMVTAIDNPEVRHTAELRGASGFVTKPFDFSDQTWAPVFSEVTPT